MSGFVRGPSGVPHQPEAKEHRMSNGLTAEQLERVVAKLRAEVDLWADAHDYWAGHGDGCQFALDAIAAEESTGTV